MNKNQKLNRTRKTWSSHGTYIWYAIVYLAILSRASYVLHKWLVDKSGVNAVIWVTHCRLSQSDRCCCPDFFSEPIFSRIIPLRQGINFRPRWKLAEKSKSYLFGFSAGNDIPWESEWGLRAVAAGEYSKWKITLIIFCPFSSSYHFPLTRIPLSCSFLFAASSRGGVCIKATPPFKAKMLVFVITHFIIRSTKPNQHTENYSSWWRNHNFGHSISFSLIFPFQIAIKMTFLHIQRVRQPSKAFDSLVSGFFEQSIDEFRSNCSRKASILVSRIGNIARVTDESEDEWFDLLPNRRFDRKEWIGDDL